MRWLLKWEGTWVNRWLIHVGVWEKPAQYCDVINLQLKISKFFKKFLHIMLMIRKETRIIIHEVSY